jgi:hypothetical protein
MSRFSWGVDGFGRCALCLRSDYQTIIFSGLLGVSGPELIYLYEEFGEC